MTKNTDDFVISIFDEINQQIYTNITKNKMIGCRPLVYLYLKQDTQHLQTQVIVNMNGERYAYDPSMELLYRNHCNISAFNIKPEFPIVAVSYWVPFFFEQRVLILHVLHTIESEALRIECVCALDRRYEEKLTAISVQRSQFNQRFPFFIFESPFHPIRSQWKSDASVLLEWDSPFGWDRLGCP